MPGSDKYIRYQRSMLFSRVIPLSWNPVMLPNRLPLLTPRSGIFGAILPRLVLLNRSMSLETEESIIMEDSMLFIFSAWDIEGVFTSVHLFLLFVLLSLGLQYGDVVQLHHRVQPDFLFLLLLLVHLYFLEIL